MFYEICIRFLAGAHSAVAYKDLIEKIELFNKCFCLVGCVTLALLFFMLLPYTYVRYYIFNLGVDSFYLFCPSTFFAISSYCYNFSVPVDVKIPQENIYFCRCKTHKICKLNIFINIQSYKNDLQSSDL